MSSTETVTLTTHVYGGEVLGRLPDGRAVFVPFALPGETVRVQLVEEKRGYARAELLEVLVPAPERVTPRCDHFLTCGNCHYQHIDYPAQLAAKTAILKDQLERIGRLVDPPVQPAVPCPQPYYYRNHVQFHLTPAGKLGYHKFRSEEIFAIHECHLPEDPLNALWPQLEVEPLPELERVALRVGVDGDILDADIPDADILDANILNADILLVLESEDPQPPDFSVEELPISAVHLGPEGVVVLAGSDYLIMEVLDRRFRVSAGSFFQVNTPMAAAMVEHVLAHLPLKQTDTVLDVYAGVGLFSAFIAPRVERLVGIEASPSACDDYAANLDEFDNVELYQATAEEVLPGLDLRPEAMVVDPPRAGIDRRALDGILALRPQVLTYVSCDPATLARDARRLTEGGYQLTRITPFDLFPQTYHIESISFWEKR
jgi:23S rRNA (uracil1939-C5)-methyltransferase